MFSFWKIQKNKENVGLVNLKMENAALSYLHTLLQAVDQNLGVSYNCENSYFNVRENSYLKGKAI